VRSLFNGNPNLSKVAGFRESVHSCLINACKLGD